jgi:hypothetical protein
MLFNNRDRFLRYLNSIMVGLPIWYSLGIVVTFSPWRLLYSYRPALDFAAIAAGCYLWIEHWPFM